MFLLKKISSSTIKFGFRFSKILKKFLLYIGLLGTISCMSILHVHKRLSRFLLDPLGILITNFLICNLGVVVSQIPFSAVSSIAGR